MKQNHIQLIIAAVLTLAGIGLLFYGVSVDPAGEIHDSVLVAFGEVATFAGSIIGIDYHYKTTKTTENEPKLNSRKEKREGSERTNHRSL